MHRTARMSSDARLLKSAVCTGSRKSARGADSHKIVSAESTQKGPFCLFLAGGILPAARHRRERNLAVIGYARVSTDEQHLDLQRDALKGAGCVRIFEDEGVSAVAKVRPGFTLALEMLCPGDTFVVWKMDRAFRSLRHALDTLELFEKSGIEFRSLTEQIDTTTPVGKLLYRIINALAEFERDLNSERTKAGMEAARKRGKRVGRPPKLTQKQAKRAAKDLAADPGLTLAALAKELKVSPRTLKRAIAEL